MRALLPLFALLPLAGCGDHRPPDPRGVGRDETFLTVSATGEAEAVPDLATIEIGVESFAADAKAAGAANAAKAAGIAKALTEFGVADKDLQTRNLSINRVDYGPRKGQFQASNVLRVRLNNVTKAGEAVAAATAAGANVLSGPSFQIADPEKANRGAYIAAYQAARTRAEAYAEAAGMKIARVLSIRDGGGSAPPMDMVYAEQAMAAPQAVQAAPPPVLRPGTNRTRVAVQVDFALEEK